MSLLKNTLLSVSCSVDNRCIFRVWLNIDDCIPLAQGDPATLVRTLEVIEMEVWFYLLS